MRHKIPYHQLIRDYQGHINLANRLGIALEHERDGLNRPSVIEDLSIQFQYHCEIADEVDNYARITYHQSMKGGKRR